VAARSQCRDNLSGTRGGNVAFHAVAAKQYGYLHSVLQEFRPADCTRTVLRRGTRFDVRCMEYSYVLI
jgi:hypothetical protein